MGKLVLIACTNVGRFIIEEIMNNPDIKTELKGVVNLCTSVALNKANYDSYADLAEKYGLPIYYCNNVNEPECIEFIKDKAPDVILQSGWSQKFHDELLNLPKYTCIGEHPAPLPKGRGAACVNWAILTGETEWGDSFFKMVSEYDKGELYAQSFFEIKEYDTVYTVYEKVAAGAAKVVRENIDDWCEGRFNAIEQDDSKATHYGRRRPTDGEIKSFDESAKVLHDFIRAQTYPYPGTYIEIKGSKLLILSSRIHHGEKSDAAPGSVLYTTEDGGMAIAVKDGVLEILRVKDGAAPTCWAGEWAEEKGIIGKNLLKEV
ncbi:MAG: methionyl-tRNA formyltransferase [Clostridia bacterium]|nr:methionyl-tRNA formyltransferase [Clostridia bacterium]